MSFLHSIVTSKRTEIVATKTVRPLATLQEEIAIQPQRTPFSFSSLAHKHAFCIGEIKPKSPSKGVLITNPQTTISLYAQSTVDMLSVLTDAPFFGGSTELFKTVRMATTKPLLRKEFIIDEYQLYESKCLGADAVLLIASLLDTKTLATYITITRSLGMDALVETHTQSEIESALAAGATTIGINNRNLDTLAIDLHTTLRLRSYIPNNCICVTESGIESPAHVATMRAAHVNGFLIGSSFLTADHPHDFLSTLLTAIHTP